MRRLLLTLAILIALVWTRPAQAATLTITVCSERELDRALTLADDFDIVTFACSGTILITRTKTIARSITLDASGQTVILDGRNAVQILRISQDVHVTIKHLSLVNGRAEVGAGGITNSGTLTLIGSTIARNQHGIVNFATLTVIDSTFADNNGVGIYNSRTLNVSGSTFSGNSHGIDNGSGVVIVANSTFVKNRVIGGFGAGIANSGTLTVINSTFAGNEASTGAAIGTHRGGKVTLQNTIIANSGRGTNCYGPMIDGGHNLQFPAMSCGKSIPVVDPRLRPAANNGGPAQTLALAPGSPALGAGDPHLCKVWPVNNRDQRGVTRLSAADQRCDIGAVEMDNAPARTEIF